MRAFCSEFPPDAETWFSTALSGDAPTVRLSKFLPTLPETHSIAVFVGAMARGKDDFADAVVDTKISISDYPLSASVACGKVRHSSLASGDAIVCLIMFPSSSAVRWKRCGTSYNPPDDDIRAHPPGRLLFFFGIHLALLNIYEKRSRC